MNVKALVEMVTPPTTPEAVEDWSKQAILHNLLKQQREGDHLALYGSSFNSGSFMIHSVLASQDALQKADPQALIHWSGNPWDSCSCGLVWGGGEPARVEFNGNRGFYAESVIGCTERLIFGRSFDGRTEDQHYYEIAQFLTHSHGLHWTPERRAWCRFDESGDVEDVIRWEEEPGREGYERAIWIDIQREVLELHMSATNTALIQMFECYCTPKQFSEWKGGPDAIVSDSENGLHYEAHAEGRGGGWMRGVQIIRPRRSSQEYGAYLQKKESGEKQFESFITYDWKNGRVETVSCGPDGFASYFQKDSPLPFATSPVFFRAEVLDKYKADPRKYSLDQRSISCRNAWSLQTYDVNEHGQVHTYIKYLGDLPHAEQIYWKSFNEPPRGGISERAFKTDFEASWDVDPDPLSELQTLVRDIHKRQCGWYTLREPDLVNQLHYPVTASDKLWNDTLIALAKVVNEGLVKKYFEDVAKQHGAVGDPKFGSILWLREALVARGIGKEIVDEVVGPLQALQQQRSVLTAHSGGDTARTLRASLLKKHRTPNAHIRHLTGELVAALRRLMEVESS